MSVVEPPLYLESPRPPLQGSCVPETYRIGLVSLQGVGFRV